MDYIFEFIGVLAGLLVTGASFPQLVKTYKSKDVSGLSYNTFLVWAGGGLCWAIYGWYLSSVQMIVFNTISFFCSVAIMIMIKKYHK